MINGIVDTIGYICLKMKKIFLTGVLCIFFSDIAFAQGEIGITAGLNSSNFSGARGGSSKNGFQAGLASDFSINKSLSFMTELLYSQKGAKFEDSVDEYPATVYLTLNYLLLSLNLALKADIGNDSKVFIFAGPYFGVGHSISAKANYKAGGKNMSIITDSPISFGVGDDDLKPFDYGLNVGMGCQFKRIFLKAQYNPGLCNLIYNLPLLDRGASLKNMNVAVTAGYYFF